MAPLSWPAVRALKLASVVLHRSLTDALFTTGGVVGGVWASGGVTGLPLPPALPLLAPALPLPALSLPEPPPLPGWLLPEPVSLPGFLLPSALPPLLVLPLFGFTGALPELSVPSLPALPPLPGVGSTFPLSAPPGLSAALPPFPALPPPAGPSPPEPVPFPPAWPFPASSSFCSPPWLPLSALSLPGFTGELSELPLPPLPGLSALPLGTESLVPFWPSAPLLPAWLPLA